MINNDRILGNLTAASLLDGTPQALADYAAKIGGTRCAFRGANATTIRSCPPSDSSQKWRRVSPAPRRAREHGEPGGAAPSAMNYRNWLNHIVKTKQLARVALRTGGNQ